MDQHVDGTSVRSLIVTMFLWTFAHITASDIATYFTIISAIFTILVNAQKFRNDFLKNRKSKRKQ